MVPWEFFRGHFGGLRVPLAPLARIRLKRPSPSLTDPPVQNFDAQKELSNIDKQLRKKQSSIDGKFGWVWDRSRDRFLVDFRRF